MERKFNYQEECQMIDTTVLLFMTNPHPRLKKKKNVRVGSWATWLTSVWSNRRVVQVITVQRNVSTLACYIISF